jgi:hypothetical protein
MILELKADTNMTFKVIETSEEYIYLTVSYIILTLAGVGIFVAFARTISALLIILISMCVAGYMFYNYSKLGDKQFKLDDCFISVNDKFIKCRQLVNGKYEYIQVALKEIKQIMEVEEGFQLWIDETAQASLFLLDKQQVKRNIVCINIFAYNVDDFLEIYARVRMSVTDETIIHENGQRWKVHSSKTDTLKMILPSFLYFIPCIIALI